MYLNSLSANIHEHQETVMMFNQETHKKRTFMSFHTRKILSVYKLKIVKKKGPKNIYVPQLVLSMKILFL